MVRQPQARRDPEFRHVPGNKDPNVIANWIDRIPAKVKYVTQRPATIVMLMNDYREKTRSTLSGVKTEMDLSDAKDMKKRVSKALEKERKLAKYN